MPRATAQTVRLEHRVVFAAVRQLPRQLEEAGRDGFARELVARAELAAGAPAIPGIVVVLGRPEGTAAGVAHRVVTGGGGGADLGASLDRAGASGFRLCGVVLDEATPVPSMVAVMSQRADQVNSVWSYTRGAVELQEQPRPPERRGARRIRSRCSRGREQRTRARGPELDGRQRARRRQRVAVRRTSVTYAAEARELPAIHSLAGLYLADFRPSQRASGSSSAIDR